MYSHDSNSNSPCYEGTSASAWRDLGKANRCVLTVAYGRCFMWCSDLLRLHVVVFRIAVEDVHLPMLVVLVQRHC